MSHTFKFLSENMNNFLPLTVPKRFLGKISESFLLGERFDFLFLTLCIKNRCGVYKMKIMLTTLNVKRKNKENNHLELVPPESCTVSTIKEN